jgi:hypothetical protein
MKCILLATIVVLTATVAQAETRYLTRGSVMAWRTKEPFKTAISGDEKLLGVQPGATNQDLIIVAKQPDGTLTASADVLVLDEQGKVVDNLNVVVTPFGGPSKSVRLFRSGKAITYLCADYCLEETGTKGLGDADSVTETRRKDGSSETWRQHNTPPSPP